MVFPSSISLVCTNRARGVWGVHEFTPNTLTVSVLLPEPTGLAMTRFGVRLGPQSVFKKNSVPSEKKALKIQKISVIIRQNSLFIAVLLVVLVVY